MRAIQHTPSHQLVRSTPNHVVRSNNMPSHLVTSTTTPSQQEMRSNMISSQDMMRRISNQHLAKSVPRPASSSQLPRNVSVKNNRDGTKEVVVETSVSVSYTFQQEGYDGQVGAEHGHKGQDAHEYHLPLEDGTAPGHQLVCCSCIVSMPSMQVGECGCLVCRLCMEMMDRPGYCKNCKIGVRYTELERIIRFPDKGMLGKLFMAPGEREEFSTKEFLKKVLKEEKDFKIVDRILNKQEAAFVRRNSLHTEELENIVKEKEEMQRKILAKSQAISELEESIRSRSEQQYQQASRPMLQYQPNLQIQQMVTQDDNHGAKPDDEQEKLDVFDINYDETDNTEFQHTMHERAVMQEMGGELVEKTVYKARPEQTKHQAKQLLDKKRKTEESTKEATFSDWNPARKEITCKAGSSLLGVEASPAVGLKSILKKKIASMVFVQENGHAISPECGEVKKKEELKEKCVDQDEKVRQDQAGSLMARDIIFSSFGDWRQTDMKGGRIEQAQYRSITQVDTPSKKRGWLEEAQSRNITQAPGDGRNMDLDNKRGRVEEAQGRNMTKVCGDWRKVETSSKKMGEMEEIQNEDRGRVMERKLDDKMKSNVDSVGKVSKRGAECQVPNDRLENDVKMSMKTLHSSSRRIVVNEQKHGPVTASQWMTRAVKGGAGMAGGAGTGRTKNRPSQGWKDQQNAGKERKALPPLSSVRHPDRRNGVADKAVTEKASSSCERKEKHNMTYDYLDMIVNRGGDVSGKRGVAEPRPSGNSGVKGGDPYGVQGLARSGGVAGRNSQLFWDQYLL